MSKQPSEDYRGSIHEAQLRKWTVLQEENATLSASSLICAFEPGTGRPLRESSAQGKQLAKWCGNWCAFFPLRTLRLNRVWAWVLAHLDYCDTGCFGRHEKPLKCSASADFQFPSVTASTAEQRKRGASCVTHRSPARTVPLRSSNKGASRRLRTPLRGLSWKRFVAITPCLGASRDGNAVYWAHFLRRSWSGWERSPLRKPCGEHRSVEAARTQSDTSNIRRWANKQRRDGREVSAITSTWSIF